MNLNLSESDLNEQLSDYQVIYRGQDDPFGANFRAKNSKLRKAVNIRVLPVTREEFSSGGTEFEDYFASWAQVQHPNLAEIVDFGESPGGHLYVVTPMCENTIATTEFQSLEQLTSTYGELLSVIGWLHEKNIVHGWIHPQLLGIDEQGTLKLDGIGFAGIAASYGHGFDASPISWYLAPEETRNRLNTTSRADLYSVGVCLYQNLTGHLPQGVFEKPSVANPGLGTGFDDAVLRALQSSPESRFDGASSFAEALRSDGIAAPATAPQAAPRRPALKVASSAPAAATTSIVTPAGTSTPGRIPKPAQPEKSFPWAVVGGIAGVIIVLAAAFFLLSSPSENRTVDREPPSKPESIRVSQTTTNSVFLDWNDIPDEGGEVSYKIYRNNKAVATASVSDFLDSDLNPGSRYVYRISTVDAAGNESLRSPEVRVRTEEENRPLLIKRLNSLRMLYPHCPDLEQEIAGNDLLRFLVGYSESMYTIFEEIQRDKPEFAEMLESDEFVNFVKNLYEKARLPEPDRDVRSGTLIGWTGEAGSEKGASEFLPAYRGPERGIVSIAGSIESGIALARDGLVATWGTDLEPPAGLENVVMVDSENGGFAALTDSGKVIVWGSDAISQADLDSWEPVARISLGGDHIVAVTKDFKILAAGSNSAAQTMIPELDRDSDPIIAVEAIGNRSYAITASGEFYFWGNSRSPKKQSFPVPREMQSSGNSLFIRERYGNDILKVNAYGDRSELEIAADEDDRIYIPQFSPDEKLFGFHRGRSRWTLTNDGGAAVDLAYWQETSRGAVDMILGNDGRFLAVVPRTGDHSPPPEREDRPRIRLTGIDDVEIPEVLAYREWTPGAGAPFRARMTGLNDGTHVVLNLSNGVRSVRPLSDFSEADQSFARSWKPQPKVWETRFDELLEELSPDRFLADAGYHPIEFLIKKGDPHVEVIVDGARADLVIDTGASSTLISDRVSEEAGLRLREGGFATTWLGRVMVFEGKVDTLEVGGVPLSNVTVGVTRMPENSSHDGLLGIDVLKRGKAAFDFGNNQLLFHREREESDPGPPAKSAYRTWTSAQGSTFKAALLGRPDLAELRLQAPDESIKNVVAKALSPRDREYLDMRKLQFDFEKAYRNYRRNLNLGDFFARQSDRWEELPAAMQGNAQIVNVTLDGRRFEFFVDTGSSSSMLSIEAAKSMGLNPARLPVVDMAGGIEGDRIPIHAADFNSLQLGNRIFHDYRLHVFNFRNLVSKRYSGTSFDGVLGNDLLIRLKAVIDLETNRILFPARK